MLSGSRPESTFDPGAFSTVLAAGLISAGIVLFVSHRAAQRIDRWWPYAAFYVTAAEALTGTLTLAWIDDPWIGVTVAVWFCAAVALWHWLAVTCWPELCASWETFWTGSWFRAAYFIHGLGAAVFLLSVLLMPSTGPMALIIFIGVSMLVVAWPFRGVPTRVSLPPRRELRRSFSAGSGVVRYSEWPRSRSRRGQTLMSGLLALAVVLVGLTMAVQLIVAGSKAAKANRQVLVASAILESELERLRVLPGSAVPVVSERRLSPPNLDQLPEARCTLTVSPYRIEPLKQVRVTLTWQSASGPERTRSLTTLVGMR